MAEEFTGSMKIWRAIALMLTMAFGTALPQSVAAQSETETVSQPVLAQEPQPNAQSSFGSSASFLNAPSPEKIAITPGGVDIRTGRLGYSATDLSIGEGAGALSLQRTMATAIATHAAPFGNLSHNWDITLVIERVLVEQYSQYDYIANVNYGARSQTFEMLYLQETVFRQKSHCSTRMPNVLKSRGR